MSNEMVLAALRRRRTMMEGAGLTAEVERIDARLAKLEPQAAAKAPKAEAPADDEPSVEMTAAAQRKADELGLTAADFAGEKPTGVTGFTVGDVERIAAAREESLDDEDDD